MKAIESVLRFLQLTFTAIILGLCGALLQQQYSGGTPTRLNYSMFAAVLAGLSLFYLIPALFMSSVRHLVVVLALDVLNFIFLICGGIALAASLGGRGCRDYRWLVWNGITNGGSDDAPKGQRCREANALTAFEWFTAFAFLASGMVVFYDMKKTGDTRRLSRAARV